MKIEFLPDGADPCPLVRLFHFRPDELERLRQACRTLADGGGAIALHDQPWVESIDGCRLVLRAAADDAGVTKSAHAPDFALALSSEGWREVEEKLMALRMGADGWNWLAEDGDARVLVSQSGQW
jgi:hypothetical protein